MARKSSLTTIARPRSTESTGGTAGRVDQLEKAMSEAAGVNDDRPVKKTQRSREGMVSTNLWMNPEARKRLKLYAYAKDEGLEEFILKALNDRLEAEEAEFRIT
ncbi:MAG: hypothetical protein AAF583_02630 [Pseudomonadota bacterium]